MTTAAPEIATLAASHVLRDTDLTGPEWRALLRLAGEVKATPLDYSQTLRGRYASMLFEKPSLRTRVTFELAMKQLGGDAVFQDHKGEKIGEREPARDMARNLDRWFDAVIARTYSHDTLEDLARWSSIPIINALSGLYHPCQAMADYLTLQERFGEVRGLKVTFVGDGNNVCHSIMLAGALLGVHVTVTGPAGYEPEPDVVDRAQQLASQHGGSIALTEDFREGVKDANAIYTDVWTSMGWEEETQERRISFFPYQVNDQLMDLARPDAVFMHCLPALRGEEVTDAVIESSRSVVFDQAENRLHAQKALLLMLLSR
ncbi:MAG: ornithine carbamoyltransferase [Acidobacteria bacterium]|nr:ornithine carbamoyltransferase [Acidobacteriota bacterium]